MMAIPDSVNMIAVTVMTSTSEVPLCLRYECPDIHLLLESAGIPNTLWLRMSGLHAESQPWKICKLFIISNLWRTRGNRQAALHRSCYKTKQVTTGLLAPRDGLYPTAAEQQSRSQRRQEDGLCRSLTSRRGQRQVERRAAGG